MLTRPLATSAFALSAALGSFSFGYANAKVPPFVISPVTHSGCCSHHQGVCGCSKNHAECCDGTESPSCGCD